MKATDLGQSPAVLRILWLPILKAYYQVLDIIKITRDTFYYSFKTSTPTRELFKQMFEIGNKSFLFIALTLGFIGMIMVYQGGYQAKRFILIDQSLVSAAFLELMVREFGPTITGLMVATKVGTGIAAEIGSMVVTEQIDALRMANTNPITYLIVPRFKACLIMVPMLAIFGTALAEVMGSIVAYKTYNISFYIFYNFTRVGWFEILIFLTKCLAYGIAIPIISGQSGLSAFGGSEGVGWATTRAVVYSSIAVIILDFLISGSAYIFETIFLKGQSI